MVRLPNLSLIHLAGFLTSFTICNQTIASEPPRLTNEWSVFVGIGSGSASTIGDDGTIYFGTLDGRLLAVAPGGPIKWSYQASNLEIRTAPALASDGTLYFGSRDRNLYAVRPNGVLKWKFKTGAWVDSSAGIGLDGTVYFGSWDKSFYAVTPEGGKKWEFKTEGEIVGSPAIGKTGRIYFGSHDGRLYALSGDGNRSWDYKAGGPIISSPAIDADETLYFSSVDGWLYAVAADGHCKWKIRTGGVTASSPVVDERGLIVLGVNGRLWMVSREGAKQVELAYSEGSITSSPLALADGSVCFVSTYGWLASVGPENKFNWALSGLQGSFSPCAGKNGYIIVMEHEVGVGDSVCSLRVGAPISTASWPTWRGNPRNTGRQQAN